MSVSIARSQGENKEEIEVDDLALIYYGTVAINRCFCWVRFSRFEVVSVLGLCSGFAR